MPPWPCGHLDVAAHTRRGALGDGPMRGRREDERLAHSTHERRATASGGDEARCGHE